MIPTYNRAYTLSRALASVFSQTYGLHEVLVVDDCSTDNTEAVVRRFPEATYIRVPENSGAGAARNLGVDRAKGDWIAFLDSDDTWGCNRIEEQVRFLSEQASRNYGLVCSGITVQEKGGSCAYHGFPFEVPPRGWTFSEFQTYPFSTPTWLIKKSVFLEAGGFDTSLPNCEDLDLLAKLVEVTNLAVLRFPLVTKYNQLDSIDADLARIEYSYSVLFSRHQKLWKSSGAAEANSHYRLGCLRLNQGQRRGARKSFIAAIKRQPTNIKLWIALVLAYFGAAAFRRAGQLWRRG